MKTRITKLDNQVVIQRGDSTIAVDIPDLVHHVGIDRDDQSLTVDFSKSYTFDVKKFVATCLSEGLVVKISSIADHTIKFADEMIEIEPKITYKNDSYRLILQYNQSDYDSVLFKYKTINIQGSPKDASNYPHEGFFKVKDGFYFVEDGLAMPLFDQSSITKFCKDEH